MPIFGCGTVTVRLAGYRYNNKENQQQLYLLPAFKTCSAVSLRVGKVLEAIA
ncbi:MAG: hypothetical protein WBB01_02900 [Phormidesmis sp.]